MGSRFVDDCLQACDMLVAEAAEELPPNDRGALDEFAAALCDLDGCDMSELRKRVGHLTVPGYFPHVRFTNLSTNEGWGGRYSMFHEPVEMDELLILIFCNNQDGWNRRVSTPQGRGTWCATEIVGSDTPGLLEIGLRFRPLQ